jgi:hypothetical protein
MHSEDYELFSRLAWQGVVITNIREPLYWLRINPESVSVKYNALQVETHLKITRRNLSSYLGIGKDLPDPVLKTLSNRINSCITAKDLSTTMQFLQQCFNLTKKRVIYTDSELREIQQYLCLHTLNILIQSNKIGFRLAGLRNLGFFFRSLRYFRVSHLPYIMHKIFNYLRYRMFQFS